VEIFLPPLRDRAGDIKLLANEFLARFAQQNGKKLSGFDERAWEWILSHNWPGNVRELKNAVERAVIMTRSDRIMASDIMPRHIRMAGEATPPMTVPEGASLADTRRQLVLRTFASTKGDIARTAKIIGIPLEDVRAEMSSLLSNNGDMHATEMKNAAAPAGVSADTARPRGSAAKPKAKKR
jgi:DNA-binding NtrC family response regulator